MATRRVLLKKTNPFKKGRGAGAGTDVKRYLKRYVDEVAKTLIKHGEFPIKPQTGEEKRNLLPEEKQGKLHSGGFLGTSSSSGHTEANKQRGWINRTIDKWTAELRNKTRRTNDGFRFVLSMAPRAVGDITESNQSSTQALFTIWEKTVELYRARHGWDSPKDELAWICGAHSDTDNAHIHILLFPTTKAGQPLKTNYRGKENHLTEFSAMANIAAEIYWRENLGLEYQDPDYQKAIVMAPTQEPELPPYVAFDGGKAISEPREKKREAPPKINTSLIAREMIPDTMVSLNGGSPVRKAKRKGIARIKSLVAAVATFKTPDWLLKMLLGKTTAAKEKEVEEKFPDENEILKEVATELKESTHFPTRRLGEKIAAGGEESLITIIHLALGNQAESENPAVLKQGIELANDYQTGIPTMPEERLSFSWNSRTGLKTLSTHTKVRTQIYRNALRAMVAKPNSRAAKTLAVLIRGAERTAHVVDCIHDALSQGIKPTGDGKFKHNLQTNEWSIENGQMIQKKSNGVPWPLHFDPTTVFEPLRNPEPPEPEQLVKKPEEIKSALDAPRPNGGGVLKKMVRIIQPKEIQRRRLERQIGKPDPDLK